MNARWWNSKRWPNNRAKELGSEQVVDAPVKASWRKRISPSNRGWWHRGGQSGSPGLIYHKRNTLLCPAGISFDEAVIEAALDDEHHAARRNALVSLFKLRGEDACDALVAAADDPSERVREWAAHLLGGVETNRAAEA